MADEIVDAFVAAYRPYVEGRLTERGVPVDEPMRHALVAGEAWLRSRLEALVATPFREQRQGPLEVFQEAMRFPTDVLDDTAVEPVPRDEVTANALPGDVHDLAPASSRDLGEDVWRAHLTWGATKAAAFRDDSG